MAPAEIDVILRRLDAIEAKQDRMEAKQDRAEAKLDRWDGALSLVRWALGFLGASGVALLVAAFLTLGGR